MASFVFTVGKEKLEFEKKKNQHYIYSFLMTEYF